MHKMKFILLPIIYILIIFSIYSGTTFIEKTNKNEEIKIGEQVEIEEAKETEETENTIELSSENNIEEEQKEEIITTEQNDIDNSKTITKKNKVSTNNNYTSTEKVETSEKTNNNKIDSVQNAEPPKETVIANKEPEKSQPIWCDEGGSKHWQGSGPNEHGYFNTWDEAWSACQEYMKGSMSGSFMVNQCPCGLYYYWVKKDD